MTHSDQGQEGFGAVQGTTSQTAPTGADKERDRKGPHLSRWFWGTIALLLVISLALNLLATWQAGRQDTEDASGRGAGDQSESKATQVERWLKAAGAKAEEVNRQIGPLLDQAYAPVYESIPAYMDFHYSLKGEWLELGAAALGDIGAGLDKYLFAGLETRLNGVSSDLAKEFDERYQGALDNTIAADALTPIVTKAINDAKSRMTKTGTIAGAAVGGASLKALTKVFATKLGTKLATKVAAKTGTKLVAVGSGAGVGGAACSWAGPGAAACAVVGAGIAWVGFDLAMIKLDEYVTRDEFERELRELIDEHKEETRRALEEVLDDKKQAADRERKAVVQEISLSELRDADRLIACQKATDILARYESIQKNLQTRSPENVEVLRVALAKQAEDHLLAPWVGELGAAVVNQDFHPWIDGEVTLAIDLPTELQEEGEIRAELRVGQTGLDFAWTEGVSAVHFLLSARPNEKIILEGPQQLELNLVQDRGLFGFNRSFNGTARFDVYETLVDGSGLTPKAMIPLTILAYKTEDPRPQVALEVPLAGVSLPKREIPGFCTK